MGLDEKPLVALVKKTRVKSLTVSFKPMPSHRKSGHREIYVLRFSAISVRIRVRLPNSTNLGKAFCNARLAFDG